MVYIAPLENGSFLVIARCDSSGWVKAIPLRTLSSRAVADLLGEGVIFRHVCFGKLVHDEVIPAASMTLEEVKALRYKCVEYFCEPNVHPQLPRRAVLKIEYCAYR